MRYAYRHDGKNGCGKVAFYFDLVTEPVAGDLVQAKTVTLLDGSGAVPNDIAERGSCGRVAFGPHPSLKNMERFLA